MTFTNHAQQRADKIRDRRAGEDREWCAECQSMRLVEDRFIEDTGDSRRTVEEYAVTVLDCGHTTARLTREYRSPLQQTSALPRAYELGRLNEWGDR